MGLEKEPPGERLQICGIPAAIVDNHNEAFYYWFASGLRNTVLLHIDAHHDADELAPVDRCPTASSYYRFTISNFMCAAVHYGIVSRAFWFNPQAREEDKLKFLGDTNGQYGISLDTRVERGTIRWANYLCGNGWPLQAERVSGDIVLGDLQFILDVDLDAFCCYRSVHNGFGRMEQQIDGWQGRIEETKALISRLKKPNLITVARSFGNGFSRKFVPPDLVGPVQKSCLHALNSIYGKP